MKKSGQNCDKIVQIKYERKWTKLSEKKWTLDTKGNLSVSFSLVKN